jgi:long-subunit fatty acid transport protein
MRTMNKCRKIKPGITKEELMKRLLVTVTLLLAAAQVFAVPNGTPAAFVNIGTARASSLGGAYVAVANDASSVFYNPAGIVNSPYKDITFMWTKQKWLVPYNYFAVAFPINKSRGAGFGMLINGDSALMEQTYIFSYCENFDWFQNIITGFNAGVSFKMQFANFGNNMETYVNKVSGSAWGIGMDFGLMWTVLPNLQVGFMMRDGFSFMKWDTQHNAESTYEGVPMTTSAGFKYFTKDMLLTAEVSDIDTLKIGVEANLYTYIDVRAGYSQTLDFEAYKEFMLGLGVGHFEFGMKRELSLNFDFAYVFGRLDNTMMIQTSFKFR